LRFLSIEDMEEYLHPFVDTDGTVKIIDREGLKGEPIDRLVYNAVFHESHEQRGITRALIKEIGIGLGVVSSSIQGLYEAMGSGEVKGFTVPAVNIRTLTYDTARAIFKTAIKNKSGAFLFEIAKSEIAYTFQEPAEYAAVIISAAIKEGWEGPVFIQGDHFQLNAKNFRADPEKEVDGVKALISKAIDAGFYNIDIDSSTLVDLDKKGIPAQQEDNYSQAANLTKYIRDLEPKGITVSVGGEIGEVGHKNSTVEELDAYMEGYLKLLPKGMKGISKMSVQTGTSHGGVPMPDGSVAKVALDFDTLEAISKRAIEKYKLSGAVQHGASTLPDELFHRFPETRTSEIHLATGFQNMIYDDGRLPSAMKEKIYGWLRDNCASERKDGETEEQFIYKTRKKGFGPFKNELWTMPEDVRASIRGDLEAKFDFLFKKLGAVNNRDIVAKHVKLVAVKPDSAREIEAASV